MTTGYSLRIRDANSRADIRGLGVALGRACIVHDVPVSVVAAQLGVTRPAVYNWFCGISKPNENLHTQIRTYIANLQ